ncbi:hypothetical protein KNLIENLN_00022 [Sinorhizobium phage NV1.1.1]|nr:hypothetical protein HAAEEKHM_00069 [Sinorhizobium phage AP-16-3]UYE95835.1 hypothetical protein KNLIENLN_00022 [Sinorhizobium phage NV1.1.1]
MDAENDNVVQVKTCTKCGETKSVELYHRDNRNGGHRSFCKSCHSADAAKWRLENPERHKEYNDKWYQENKARKNKKAREWQNNNPDKVRAYQEKWRSENPEKAREQHKKADDKKRSTPKGRLENNVKAAVHRGLTKGSKNGRRTFEVLGYTLDDLRKHLERKFKPGMTWDNYGEWHVDHIIPLAAHNYETPDDPDFKRAWALSNLQPLWRMENQSKSAKLTKPFQPSLLLATNDNRKSPQKETNIG